MDWKDISPFQSACPSRYQKTVTLPSGNDPKILYLAREGWNWGAFIFSWIWLLCHNMVPSGIALFLISFFFGPLTIAASIYLGIKGNELAWTYRPFKNLQHFEETEKAWSKWGLILFFGWFGFILLMFIFIFSIIPH